MPTGNAIQTATVASGGGGAGAGTATVALNLADATGTVNVSGATAPGAAGSVLTSSNTSTAIWSTTTGTVGSAGVAGFATNAGTATVSGTATIANALNASSGTVNVSGQASPAVAGSILTVTQVSAGGTLASWSTTAGTTGSAAVCTNAGTSTVSGTSTITNALNTSGGTVNVSGQAAPGAAGSVLTVTQVSAGGTLATWSTTAGTVGSASITTTAGTATIANALTVSGGTVGVSAATAPGAAGSVLVSSSANTATWGVVTAAAGAPPGGAIGTQPGTGTTHAVAGTATALVDAGPGYVVPANTVGTGTAYHAVGWVGGTGTLPVGCTSTILTGLAWGGTAGVLLFTNTLLATTESVSGAAFVSTCKMDADIVWQSNSAVAVQVIISSGHPVSSISTTLSTVVTGLTTTSNETFTFFGSLMMANAGTGTVFPLLSQIYQVH